MSITSVFSTVLKTFFMYSYQSSFLRRRAHHITTHLYYKQSHNKIANYIKGYLSEYAIVTTTHFHLVWALCCTVFFLQPNQGLHHLKTETLFLWVWYTARRKILKLTAPLQRLRHSQQPGLGFTTETNWMCLTPPPHLWFYPLGQMVPQSSMVYISALLVMQLVGVVWSQDCFLHVSFQ